MVSLVDRLHSVREVMVSVSSLPRLIEELRLIDSELVLFDRRQYRLFVWG